VPDDVKVSEKEGYEVVRCGWCGIMRTTEREDNYETLYTEGTRYHVEEMDKIGRDHYGDRFDHDFDIAWDKRIPALLGQYRIIDVGCANGAFVSAMQQNGFQAEGIELNPTMAETARAVTGCPIHESWALVSGQFDIVTYHDVFEHVVNPRQELQLIRKYLRPNGLLVLDCPDAAEIFGATARASHHEKPQQHLFYYTIDTLSALLISEGFYIGAVERPIVGKIVLYARKENGTT
jgi:SAM-dependent methyltransferase